MDSGTLLPCNAFLGYAPSRLLSAPMLVKRIADGQVSIEALLAVASHLINLSQLFSQLYHWALHVLVQKLVPNRQSCVRTHATRGANTSTWGLPTHWQFPGKSSQQLFGCFTSSLHRP